MGHMFLHKKANAIFMDTRTNFNSDKFEIEADTFAMDLLVGDDVLSEHSSSYNTEQIARLLGYEKRLIELRLRESNYGLEIQKEF